VLVILGAAEILLSERAPLPLVIHIGLQGLAGYLVPLILLLCGMLLLINPTQRMFYAVLAIVLALLSWITSNLGGFFIGMILGVIGGALALAWTTTGRLGSPRWLRHKPSSSEPSAGLDLILGDRDTNAHAVAEAIPRQSSWAGRALPASPLAVAIVGVAVYHAGVLGQQPVNLAANASPKPSSSVSPSPLPSPTASASPSPTASVRATPPVGVGPSPIGMPPRPGQAPPLTLRGPGPAAVVWTLTAASAAVTGLSFDGVARILTTRGVVFMLKFSLGSMVLSGGTGLTFSEAGRSIVTRALSLDFSGNITLYTTKISAELHGRMVVYTPKKPPVNLSPDLTLTNVVANQPFAFADTFVGSGLTISEPAG
jgi:hypothetical protein